MKVMVAVPTHDQMPAMFGYDLAQMMGFLGANYVSEEGPIEAVNITFVTGTYVHKARNDLAEIAMTNGVDYVLWLDSDMRFPRHILTRLLARKRDIVGINYSSRTIPPHFVAFKDVEAGERLVSTAESTGVEEVEAMGFGAVLMRTDALRKIAETHPDDDLFAFGKNNAGFLVGEDVWFCNLAREAGFTIYVDHDMSKECGHVGVMEYRLDHAQAMDER